MAHILLSLIDSNTLQVFAFSGSTPTQVGSVLNRNSSNPISCSWSSDGTHIAVVNNDSNTLQVFAFSGSTPTQVGSNATTGTTHLHAHGLPMEHLLLSLIILLIRSKYLHFPEAPLLKLAAIPQQDTSPVHVLGLPMAHILLSLILQTHSKSFIHNFIQITMPNQ